MDYLYVSREIIKSSISVEFISKKKKKKEFISNQKKCVNLIWAQSNKKSLSSNEGVRDEESSDSVSHEKKNTAEHVHSQILIQQTELT